MEEKDKSLQQQVTNQKNTPQSQEETDEILPENPFNVDDTALEMALPILIPPKNTVGSKTDLFLAIFQEAKSEAAQSDSDTEEEEDETNNYLESFKAAQSDFEEDEETNSYLESFKEAQKDLTNSSEALLSLNELSTGFLSQPEEQDKNAVPMASIRPTDRMELMNPRGVSRKEKYAKMMTADLSDKVEPLETGQKKSPEDPQQKSSEQEKENLGETVQSMASLKRTVSFDFSELNVAKRPQNLDVDLNATKTFNAKDLYQTGKVPIKRPKKAKKSGQEGGDFHAVACQDCGRFFKITHQNAGQRVRCGGCEGIVILPDAKFYLRKDLSSEILGPFPVSKQKLLVTQNKVDPGMYISLDREKWKIIEFAGKDLLTLMVQFSPSAKVRKEAIRQIDDQIFLFRIAMTAIDQEMRKIAISRIRDQKLLDRVIIKVQNNPKILSLALRNIKHPGLIVDYIHDLQKYGLVAHVMKKMTRKDFQILLKNIENRIDQASTPIFSYKELQALYSFNEKLEIIKKSNQ